MMEKVICQSCGMPLNKESDFGTNVDGNKCAEYCFYCFQKGRFLDEGITLQEKIDKNVGFAVKMGWNENDARKMASELLPKLKRWNIKIGYKEVKKSAMKFVGIGIDTSVQNASKDCPKTWQEFMKRYKEIKNYIGGMKNYGVCINPNQAECTFRYVACAQVSSFEDIPKGMEKVEIPQETHFVFMHKGKLSKLGETYGGIMETMPKTNRKQKSGFWIEFYDYRWKGDKDESEFEIWIPVE